jgi:predicted nucleotidyltransferase/DNA-binding XRE family transcriptional regulator
MGKLAYLTKSSKEESIKMDPKKRPPQKTVGSFTLAEMSYLRMKQSLSESLKTYREEKGIAFAQLAERLGASESFIAQMEIGDAKTSLDMLIRAFLALEPTREELSQVMILATQAISTSPKWTASKILDFLAQKQEALQGMGVQRLGLFGSYSRGEASGDSDMDFLAVLEQPSFKRYMDVKFFLEDLFHSQVDLVLEDSLREEIRPRVLSEVKYVAGL